MWNYQDQIRETESGKLISPPLEAGIFGEKAGSGIPIPFPFVDFKKMWNVISDPTLFKGPEVSEKEGRAIVAEYKRQYNEYKRKGGTRSYGSWIKWKGYGKRLKGRNLWVPGGFGVPNIDPKLLKAFSKSVPNHHGYMDVLQKNAEKLLW